MTTQIKYSYIEINVLLLPILNSINLGLCSFSKFYIFNVIVIYQNNTNIIIEIMYENSQIL